MQSSKAWAPNLHLLEVDVCIDITWDHHLTEAEPYNLCDVMRICTVGKCGPVTLLLKHPDHPVQKANLLGITTSPHISRLEPWAFYTLATAVHQRALGGPCLATGMIGVSLQVTVRTMHMKLLLTRLQRWVVEVLVTDLANVLGVIALNVHQIVGARVGLGDAGHLATHMEGFWYALPLSPWQWDPLAKLLGTAQGTI